MPISLPPPPDEEPQLPRAPRSTSGSMLSALVQFPVYILMGTVVPLLAMIAPAVMSFFMPGTPTLIYKGPMKKRVGRWVTLALASFYGTYALVFALTIRALFVPASARQMDTWWMTDAFTVAPVVRSLGILFSIMALGLYLWGYMVIGPVYGGDNAPVVHERHTLITAMPYSKVRHPMACGRIVMVLLAPLTSLSAWLVIPALAHAASALWLTFLEDRLLRDQFPPQHVALCHKAGHLWPHNLIKLLLS
ncbi:hypothetical protein PAPYR_11845 [Paratrimastix pyriformis]|uniref:Uncharacterized protein n=1 Tax=Paratrimastix pyriformis TaxID=342808 RepID=A0ABQ8U5D1_9EUKA|nr:hypothetical protein PAPYR_11845 [Paratrimastix pyriformis]|eukprot:GAFH01004048.1.p1 GENE.GAFH01004048.1~~GAFH01004048.1.p1  ORF type:complete len:249 (-),score=35.82 GAFH01004048.1:60-806(-)